MTAVAVPLVAAALPWFLQKIFGGSSQGGSSNAWSGQPAHQIGSLSNFNPYQNVAFENFAKSASNYDLTKSPVYGAASNYLTNILNSQFDPGQYNQMFEKGVANPLVKTYQEQILPMQRQNYYSPGAIQGSALNQAQMQSDTALANTLGSLKSNYLMQAQEGFQNRQASALAQALGLAQAPAAQNLAYYNQLFGARPTTPILQEGQTGWLQNIMQMLMATGGPVAMQYFLNKMNQPQQQQPLPNYQPISPYTMGGSLPTEFNQASQSPTDWLKQQIGTGSY